MVDEKLQFAISQYIDGTLPTDQLAQLEERLKVDAEARKLFEEFRRLNDLMNVAMPVPEMDWEQLTHKISAAVDRSIETPDTIVLPREPAKVWWATWQPVALAASLLICVGVAWVTLRSGTVQVSQPLASTPKPVVIPEQATPEVVQPKPAAIAQVEVYATAAPQGEAQVDVQISGTQTPAALQTDNYQGLTATEPASVTIAAVPVPDVDADSFALQ